MRWSWGEGWGRARIVLVQILGVSEDESFGLLGEKPHRLHNAHNAGSLGKGAGWAQNKFQDWINRKSA